MITLKNKETNRYIEVDGYYNYNGIHRAKELLGKKNYCKSVKIMHAYGVDIALITVIKCGYNVLVVDGKKEINLPPAIHTAVEVIKQTMPSQFIL